MNENNNKNDRRTKPGDLHAARNCHHDMHSLLSFICQDDFGPFSKLSGTEQQGVLRILRKSSEDLGEILEPF